MRKSFLYAALFLFVCIQSNTQASLTHRYSFTNGDSGAVDSVGGSNGTLEGEATISSNAVQLNGTGAYVNLPGAAIAINTFPAITLEMWSTQPTTNQSYSMTAAFGNTWSNGNGRDYLMIATTRGDNVSRGAIANTPDDSSPWLDEVGVNGAELNDGLEHQYVLTVSNTEIIYYIDGVSKGTASMGTTTISGLSNQYAYLGRSLYTGDARVNCSINEFRIYNSILTADDIALHYSDGPNVVRPSPIVIQETGGSTEVTEGNSTPDIYTVALSSQPDSTVTLTVDPDEQLDIGSGRGNPVDIDFNSLNWNTPRIVEVNAFDDDVWETEPHTGIISHSISSSDPDFNDVPLPSVSVTVWDNECGAWGFYYSDLNYNCIVDFKDFAIFASYWLSQFDNDNLEILASEWLKTTQPYAAGAEYGPVQDSPNPLSIEPNDVIGLIDEKTYGQFLEHIYHSANGGLWGELVWNRSFERYSGGLGTFWTSYGSGGTFTITSTSPKNSTYCQKIVSTGAETGIQQTPPAYINIKTQTYRGSLWARSDTQPSSLFVRLKNGSTTIQEQPITVTSSSWAEYPFTFTPSVSAEDATLQVGVTGSETVYLDQVSMMGQDANATGGYRPDLLQAVEDLHPPCIRWPGGCFASAYLWKGGIGPQAQRVSYPIVLWDDKDVDSYGTDEFIRMCHAMGAEPIIVINTGLLSVTCGVTITGKKTAAEYLADAEDWVEYCNGPASSTWGAVRAANGHPEPYNVKYWEIDNETWAAGSAAYSAKVQTFVPAMKAVDPNIKIIACGGNGLDMGWNQDVIDTCATEIDYISVHNYDELTEYMSGPDAYDSFITTLANYIANSANPDMKIDNSEWNAQSTDWRTGLYAGGILNVYERHGDVFKIGGPALFLRHTSAGAWDNAFINFDHTGWFPAPNYVVMKLWRDHYAPYRIDMTGLVGNLNAIATKSDDGSKIYFKVVNPTDVNVPVRLIISDTFDAGSASLQLVAPGSLSARNSLASPNTVHVEDRYVNLNGQTIRFTMPPFSAGVVQVNH